MAQGQPKVSLCYPPDKLVTGTHCKCTGLGREPKTDERVGAYKKCNLSMLNRHPVRMTCVMVSSGFVFYFYFSRRLPASTKFGLADTNFHGLFSFLEWTPIIIMLLHTLSTLVGGHLLVARFCEIKC